MNCKRSSIGLAAVLIFVLLSCGDCKPPFRIIKRPGKNPLKCFKKGGQSKCIEVTSKEAGSGGGRVEDPHDVKKGPLGGKIYKVGGSMMECFPNGQCFSVNEKDLKKTPMPTTVAPTTLSPTTLAPTTLAPTTLAPTTLAPTAIVPTLAPYEDEKDMETIPAPTTLSPTTLAPTTLAPTTLAPTTLAPTAIVPTLAPYEDEKDMETIPAPTTPVTKKPPGRFFRRGKEILECFPTGKCSVVVVLYPEPGSNCGKTGKDGGNNGSNGDLGNNLNDDANGDDENNDTNGDGGNNETDDDIGNFGVNDDFENDLNNAVNDDAEKYEVYDEYGDNDADGGPGNKRRLKGFWDYVDYNYDDYDIEYIGSGTIGDNSTNQNDQEKEPGSSGKAICVFKSSEAVKGSIILVEESPLEVIGKLHGLKEGIHVLSFHETGDVESEDCSGVGDYHRPSEIETHLVEKRSSSPRLRPRRQAELFEMGEHYMDDAYDNCLKHVETCQADELSSHVCVTYVKRCIPILKCKACKDRVETEINFDTIGDLEKSSHLNFTSEMPRNSLFIFADDQGESDFAETEKEHSLLGPDSVMHRSIVLSTLPKNPEDDFERIACCRIETVGRMIIL